MINLGTNAKYQPFLLLVAKRFSKKIINNVPLWSIRRVVLP